MSPIKLILVKRFLSKLRRNEMRSCFVFAELQVEQMRLKRQQEQRGKSGRKYKFVSQLNAQGFIEGALVALLLSFVTDRSAPVTAPLCSKTACMR